MGVFAASAALTSSAPGAEFGRDHGEPIEDLLEQQHRLEAGLLPADGGDLAEIERGDRLAQEKARLRDLVGHVRRYLEKRFRAVPGVGVEQQRIGAVDALAEGDQRRARTVESRRREEGKLLAVERLGRGRGSLGAAGEANPNGGNRHHPEEDSRERGRAVRRPAWGPEEFENRTHSASLR